MVSAALQRFLNERQPLAANCTIERRESLPFAWVRRLLRVPEPDCFTWKKTIFVRIGWHPDGIRDDDLNGIALLAHERTHVEQWVTLGVGMWLRYLTPSGRKRLEREAAKSGFEIATMWGSLL